MIERIDNSSSSSPSERKKTPDSSGFKKAIEEVEKVGETEFEKPKKQFFQAPPEEEETPRSSSPLKSYLSDIPSHRDEVPESPSFYQRTTPYREPYRESSPQETKKTQQSPSQKKETERKESDEENEGKEQPIEKKGTIFSLQAPKGKKEEKEKKVSFVKKDIEEPSETIVGKEVKVIKKMPLAEKSEEKKAPLAPPKESLFAVQKKEEKSNFVRKPAEIKEEKIKRKEDTKQKKEEGKKELLPQTKETFLLKEIPPNVMAEATAAASALSPYVKVENMPLFERMIGTILQMKVQGLERCEIMLTSSQFLGSKYYGTKIIFEKYASSPDSFNIHLTGSNEAVTAFNENLDGLMQAFEKGNFSFKVGRLWAEYETERPLFKRKSSVGEEGAEGDKET